MFPLKIIDLSLTVTHFYRFWKQEQLRRHLAVTRIAARVRGIQQRKRYKKNYRLLVRQRELRIRAKRLNAAITIQCAYRCLRARRRIVKQRKVVEEREREKRELQELEDSIQGLHERWMHELMAIRAQTGVRGMLARRYVSLIHRASYLANAFPSHLLVSLLRELKNLKRKNKKIKRKNEIKQQQSYKH